MEEEFIQKLRKKFDKIINSSFLDFDMISKKSKISGVYFVYYNKDEKPIYIGSTNNFHVRFGIDMKDKSTHTLHKKLLNEKSKSEVLIFLKEECKYKIEECADKIEAEALEHFAIWVFKPKYNAYIYKNLNNKDLKRSI